MRFFFFLCFERNSFQGNNSTSIWLMLCTRQCKTRRGNNLLHLNLPGKSWVNPRESASMRNSWNISRLRNWPRKKEHFTYANNVLTQRTIKNVNISCILYLYFTLFTTLFMPSSNQKAFHPKVTKQSFPKLPIFPAHKVATN
jgi:hypothetical protein